MILMKLVAPSNMQYFSILPVHKEYTHCYWFLNLKGQCHEIVGRGEPMDQ
jgi:hypothetical protein